MIKPVWTSDQVSNFAPDAASIKAAQKLNTPGKWPLLGVSDIALWGECKGSGSRPYQTSIDFSEPAFKCSCPSRKFPCKHALALAFIYADQPDSVTATDTPAWTSEWLGKRQQRQEKKQAKQDEPVDPATQQKRAAAKQKRQQKREENVNAGVLDLQRWLEDNVRQGLANRADDNSFWHSMAQRMVDAQAPGLAAWLRRCADIRFQHTQWQAVLLSEIGRLYLLLQAWQRLPTLPPALQHDVRQRIGFPVNKDEFSEEAAVTDIWQVAGMHQDEIDGLNRQYTWLYGQGTQQFALLLDFAARGQILPVYPAVGSLMAAQLAYHPSEIPTRASIYGQNGWELVTEQLALTETALTIDDNLIGYAQALAKLPWLANYPFLLQGQIVRQKKQWYWQDAQGQALMLTARDETIWQILALTGGQPCGLFAEWDGATINPLSIWVDGQCQGLPGVNV